jgi:hypothetical protein
MRTEEIDREEFKKRTVSGNLKERERPITDKRIKYDQTGTRVPRSIISPSEFIQGRNTQSTQQRDEEEWKRFQKAFCSAFQFVGGK